MFKKLLITLAAAVAMSVTSASAAYYACGGFNGWDPTAVQEFTLTANGIYNLKIDFRQSTSFKISTMKPTSLNTSAAWGEFNSGAVVPAYTPAINESVELIEGITDITAPDARILTVLINSNVNKIAFSDNTKAIDWGESVTPDPVGKGAGIYACGSFNGWNPSEAVEFTVGNDGLYYLNITFSQDAYASDYVFNYKLSTVKPNGNSGSPWTEFDSGAMQVEGTPELYKGLNLVSGFNNSVAPAFAGELTLVINPTLKKLAYTDGKHQINWDTETPLPTEKWSGSLPVLFINTENNAPVVSKEEYLKGTYYLDPMGIEGVKAFGTADEPLPLQIKGRGNYTWIGFDKKPYRLKLDSKAALLGMKKSKHFALLAHADDNRGFMRNAVGFEVARRIGLEWTPNEQPVEVVLNGEYIGLYFLTETIRVDSDRVNVYEQPDGDKSTNVTGGWLVELDNYDDDPHVEFYSQIDWYRMIFTYKTPEELNSAQESWLSSQMRAIDSALNSPDKSKATWLEYVDLDELVKFYIVQEVMDNYESFSGSCYMHRDVDDASLSVDGKDTHKWKFGPVWDFGSVFFSEKKQYCYQGREHHMAWICQMCQFPEFMDAVKAKWREFYPAQYGDIDSFIQKRAEAINSAAKCDFSRWACYGNPDVISQSENIKRLMNISVNWLKDRWGRGYYKGDANGDDEITISDVVTTCNYILNLNTDKFVKTSADMNNDGEITVSDVVDLINYILTLEN